MAVLLGIMRSNALMRDEACTCWKGAERNPQSHMRAWILFVCSVYALCFFLLCRTIGTVEEKGFLAACKDKAKIQLIGLGTQKVYSIGMISYNVLRTMSILQKTEEGSVMPWRVLFVAAM